VPQLRVGVHVDIKAHIYLKTMTETTIEKLEPTMYLQELRNRVRSLRELILKSPLNARERDQHQTLTMALAAKCCLLDPEINILADAESNKIIRHYFGTTSPFTTLSYLRPVKYVNDICVIPLALTLLEDSDIFEVYTHVELLSVIFYFELDLDQYIQPILTLELMSDYLKEYNLRPVVSSVKSYSEKNVRGEKHQIQMLNVVFTNQVRIKFSCLSCLANVSLHRLTSDSGKGTCYVSFTARLGR
jgi:hypothetical protein